MFTWENHRPAIRLSPLCSPSEDRSQRCPCRRNLDLKNKVKSSPEELNHQQNQCIPEESSVLQINVENHLIPD